MNSDAEPQDAAAYAADIVRNQVAKWVRDAIATSGVSAAEIGRRLRAYGLELDRNAMSGLKNGKRQLQAVEMLALAEITGAPLPGRTVIETEQRLSPAFLRELLAALCREAGLSDPEAERLVAGALKIARKLEDRRGSDDYSRSLRDQAEALATMLFPERPPKE